MKSIKIVKRKRDENSNDVKTSDREKSVEQTKREMVGTVKSWIAELQRRKHAQRYSFSQLSGRRPGYRRASRSGRFSAIPSRFF